LNTISTFSVGEREFTDYKSARVTADNGLVQRALKRDTMSEGCQRGKDARANYAQLKLHTGGEAPVSQVAFVPGQSSELRQVIVQLKLVDEGT
jgi:hypothetical protein